MIITAYARFLQEENRYLKDRIEALERRNQELVIALTVKTPLATATQAPQHQMKKGSQSATCSCGWNFASADPAELQDAIRQHYGNSSGLKRKSWGQIRQMAEAQAE